MFGEKLKSTDTLTKFLINAKKWLETFQKISYPTIAKHFDFHSFLNAVMAIYFSSLPLALGGLWIAGIPDLTALPVILLSAILQTGYSISLFKAYDQGPLSSVYPVARGSAPLFIFGLSYIFFDPIDSLFDDSGYCILVFGYS